MKSISLLQVSVLGDYAEFQLWCICVTSVESIPLLQVSVLRDYAEFQKWCTCVTSVESISLLQVEVSECVDAARLKKVTCLQTFVLRDQKIQLSAHDLKAITFNL